jgi:hypothetical protein
MVVPHIVVRHGGLHNAPPPSARPTCSAAFSRARRLFSSKRCVVSSAVTLLIRSDLVSSSRSYRGA